MKMSVLLADLIERMESIQGDEQLLAFARLMKKYAAHWSQISTRLYEKLDGDDRQRFVTWLLKRWGGLDQVNPVEMSRYLEMVERVKTQECEALSIEGGRYKLQDMRLQGYDFRLAAYNWVLSVHDIYYNQYEHKEFRVRAGDVIIDAGGFIGDTAALFCVKTDGDCFVHAFEVLDENLRLFHYNNELNGITDKVRVNRLALTDCSGQTLGVKPAALQGATSVMANDALEEQVETITLDDYVIRNRLERVDLIKMDIEGAEMPALKGAINTIRHFRPRLALCLYHKWDDIITIPRFLEETGLDYRLCFKWVQLTHGWEAVLLAEPVATGSHA
ncbi:FkbM family methyltransferase [Pseudomonas sp. LFM046]|uniref:FkbM family methyltransferase n=1 Tax=Pseudomonas sp. LFM046 TaxID=1608357 RepID=UPI000698C4C1|nr:FkbM family methyltransferase [Pseudomonas sp. LFM046]